MLITGPTTGVKEFELEDMMVNDERIQVAKKEILALLEQIFVYGFQISFIKLFKNNGYRNSPTR